VGREEQGEKKYTGIKESHLNAAKEVT